MSKIMSQKAHDLLVSIQEKYKSTGKIKYDPFELCPASDSKFLEELELFGYLTIQNDIQGTVCLSDKITCAN